MSSVTISVEGDDPVSLLAALRRLFCGRAGPRIEGFQVLLSAPRLEEGGAQMAAQMKADTFVTASVAGQDKEGNPVPLPSDHTCVWDTSDEAVLQIGTPDQPTTRVDAAKAGIAQLNVQVSDVDGNVVGAGTLDIEVLAGNIANIAIQLSEPSPEG